LKFRMERVKRVLVLGEAKVGKTWLLAQLFKDISSSKRQQEQMQHSLQDESIDH
jgi:GTPase SAR1 family protein